MGGKVLECHVVIRELYANTCESEVLQEFGVRDGLFPDEGCSPWQIHPCLDKRALKGWRSSDGCLHVAVEDSSRQLVVALAHAHTIFAYVEAGFALQVHGHIVLLEGRHKLFRIAHVELACKVVHANTCPAPKPHHARQVYVRRPSLAAVDPNVPGAAQAQGRILEGRSAKTQVASKAHGREALCLFHDRILARDLHAAAQIGKEAIDFRALACHLHPAAAGSCGKGNEIHGLVQLFQARSCNLDGKLVLRFLLAAEMGIARALSVKESCVHVEPCAVLTLAVGARADDDTALDYIRVAVVDLC